MATNTFLSQSYLPISLLPRRLAIVDRPSLTEESVDTRMESDSAATHSNDEPACEVSISSLNSEQNNEDVVEITLSGTSRNLEDMTLRELKAVAADANVSLVGVSGKKAILAKLKEMN